MSILFLHTAPPPALHNTDATFQETALLRSAFGGTEMSLYPLDKPSSMVPRSLYGWHILDHIRKYQSKTRINHVFSPDLKYYPILNKLHNPTIMTVQAGTFSGNSMRSAKLKNLDGIIVSSPREAEKMQKAGFGNVHIIPTGVDTNMIEVSENPLRSELVLLMASAPWELSQFRVKGVDLLLQCVARDPKLKLILLWRGSLVNEINRLIQKYAVHDKVELINKHVDINEIFARVHGTVLMASKPTIVKSYPHSLVESLAGGKPVILNRTIPMSDYVEKNRVGVVIEKFGMNGLAQSIEQFKKDYDQMADTTRSVLAHDFEPQQMVSAMGDLYRRIGALAR